MISFLGILLLFLVENVLMDLQLFVNQRFVGLTYRPSNQQLVQNKVSLTHNHRTL